LAASGSLTVKFWGVRGGIACPGPETVRYGGNTACIEMRCGDNVLIFDAGTGIRALGGALIQQSPVSADIFFSRTGFERICGIPFFAAGYHPANAFRFWGDHLPEGKGVRDALSSLMSDPVFPVPISIMGANLEFRDFDAGEVLEPSDDVKVRTVELNRDTAVTGYRIEWGGKSIAYVSDLVPGAGGDETAALEVLDGADMAILNTARHAGDCGDWRDGLRLCDTASAGVCVLFHHDPDDDDDALDRIAEEAQATRPGTIVAQEGSALEV
jgi:phosphoribosyl 1,2-cyclic phosphodiesterase